MTERRAAVLIVLDGAGAGELPDSAEYGDRGCNTLSNVSRAAGGLRLPNLGKLGLGNITEIIGVRPVPKPSGFHGTMLEASKGKDTTTGHWEMCGVVTRVAFPTFPNGFPPEIIDEFTAISGLEPLGNRPASGTEIIREMGDEHVRTGRPIVYTSADSVFQVAAHEEVISLDRLYEICAKMREKLDSFRVGRVIARPFTGKSGGYTRTAHRRDFSMPPSGRTCLDALKEKGVEVVGIGKIEDIFAGRGLTGSIHSAGNRDCTEDTIRAAREMKRGLVFTNLVDFDMLYGHRKDPRGFAVSLEEFDGALPEIISALSNGDLLIITADHGCDPTIPGTDHTRERVPLIAYSGGRGGDLGERRTFADVGATICDYFGVGFGGGKSFLGEMF